MERLTPERFVSVLGAAATSLVVLGWLACVVDEWWLEHDRLGAAGALVVGAWVVARAAHLRGVRTPPWVALGALGFGALVTAARPAPTGARYAAPLPELHCTPIRELAIEAGVWRARVVEREGSLFPRDVVWERDGPHADHERLDGPRGLGARGVCVGRGRRWLEYRLRVTDAPGIFAIDGPTADPAAYVPLDASGLRADDQISDRSGDGSRFQQWDSPCSPSLRWRLGSAAHRRSSRCSPWTQRRSRRSLCSRWTERLSKNRPRRWRDL